MAQLGPSPDREAKAALRDCGSCSQCCSVLRVDELGKPAGRDCIHQNGGAGSGAASGADLGTAGGGCGIYETRPAICRGYQCLWLQGGLEDDERPDQTGGIVDLEARGTGVELRIQEVRSGAFDASPALQSIAARYREQMPVRIANNEHLADPDRPYRVFMAEGLEHRVAGDWVESFRDGVLIERLRQPWAERAARRIGIWRRKRALSKLSDE